MGGDSKQFFRPPNNRLYFLKFSKLCQILQNNSFLLVYYIEGYFFNMLYLFGQKLTDTVLLWNVNVKRTIIGLVWSFSFKGV